MATQDDYIRTALRVPPDLHARIHEQAKANNRTFNAEIVERLEGSFAPQTFLDAAFSSTGFSSERLQSDVMLASLRGKLQEAIIERDSSLGAARYLDTEKTIGDISEESYKQTKLVFKLEVIALESQISELQKAISKLESELS